MPGTLRTARPRAQLRQGRNDWYRITNAVAGGPAVVHIYDEIGYWGVTASDFVRELSALTATEIELHVNSPGGEIFDGIAIANALRSHPAAVTVYVDSLAASIASVISMAGDRVLMAPNSQLMIHDGSGMCIGNAAEMRQMAELLDRQSDNIASVYAAKAGGTVAEWRARMEAETWYTAEEAVEAGLADEVLSSRTSPDGNSPQNSWDLSVFRYPSRSEAPSPFVASVAVADPPQAEVEQPAAEDTSAPDAEPVAVEPELDEPTAEATADDPAPPDAVEPPLDPWGDVVAHLTAPREDPWAALTAHLTTPNPSHQRGDQS